MDVFFLEIYETPKNICLTKGKYRGLHAKRVCIQWSIFFVCEFLDKYFKDGPWLSDEECASYVIDGEKTQYSLKYTCWFLIGVDENVVLNKFVIYHMDCVNQWIDLYDIKRE